MTVEPEFGQQQATAANFAAAFERAFALDAIASRIRVRASEQLDGFRFVVDPTLKADPARHAMPYIAFTPASVNEGFPAGPVVTWFMGEAFDDFVAKLTAALDRANLPTVPPGLDVSGTFARLVAMPELAIRLHEASLDQRIQGRLVEVVDDDWVVTDSGLESRRRDLVIAAAEFYEASGDRQPPRAKTPPIPADVDAQMWTVLVGAAHAGVRRSAPAMS